MTVIPPGPEGWAPGRGDYGCEYATDLIPIIERLNCVHGCANSGTPEAKAEYGPGGDCAILAATFLEKPIPELDPRPEGPHCRARIPLDGAA